MPYNPDDLMVQCDACKDWYISLNDLQFTFHWYFPLFPVYSVLVQSNVFSHRILSLASSSPTQTHVFSPSRPQVLMMLTPFICFLAQLCFVRTLTHTFHYSLSAAKTAFAASPPGGLCALRRTDSYGCTWWELCGWDGHDTAWQQGPVLPS